MMQWLVCEPVPDAYVPMLFEEMELDGRDARLVPSAGKAEDFPVVVIGCGESGLLAGIRLMLWETEVTEASWDDTAATRTVRTRDRRGTTTELPARAVITAVGQLDRPHIPTIEGQHEFAGPTFHSSAWDHSVDLKTKRVAMIGAGASGFQIARGPTSSCTPPDSSTPSCCGP